MATNSNTIPDPDPASATAPSFEAALAELEGIVAAMEAGKMPLQDALDAYKRGVALLRQCQATLRRRNSRFASSMPTACASSMRPPSVMVRAVAASRTHRRHEFPDLDGRHPAAHRGGPGGRPALARACPRPPARCNALFRARRRQARAPAAVPCGRSGFRRRQQRARRAVRRRRTDPRLFAGA
jgi:exodeoxyribonuclease VII small subunit